MRTIFRHILLWLVVYVVYTYMTSVYDNLQELLLINLINVFLFMLAYYSLRYWQIPRLYDKGKKTEFILSFLITSFMISAVCRISGYLWIDTYLGRTEEIPFITLGAYLIKTARYYSPAMALLAWETYQARGKELARIQQLEKEKLATELKFLKAQINPHFLFNTLNNLYAIVLTQPPKAPKMIMQLSGILDYVLYKSKSKFVQLQEEVKTIEHFLELEQIRYGERLMVTFSVSGNLHLPISPLILLSIVENAFKHGASGDIEQPKITIQIEGKEDAIFCKVCNTKSQNEGELNDAYKEGIGLSNIQRQLDLIYPESQELKIKNEPHYFSIALTIQCLSEYQKSKQFV